MAQFDVYRNENPQTNKDIPYILDVQNNLLNDLSTHVIVPLRLVSKINQSLKNLNPSFEINGDKFVMATAALTAAPVKVLNTKVCSLANKRYEILAAIDFLLTGF